MWLFSKYGFYSVVCARKGFGHPHEPIDPDRLMVRARTKAHLERLKDAFPVLADAEIFSFPGDYPFRLFVAKAVFAVIMQEMVEQLDYDNFKQAVAESDDTGVPAYEQSLHQVWAVMRGLETRR